MVPQGPHGSRPSARGLSRRRRGAAHRTEDPRRSGHRGDRPARRRGALEIRLAGMAFTVTMRTPGDDEDLVAGLLYAEGIIREAESLDVIARYRGPEGGTDPGNVINVILKGDLRIARERLRRSLVATSACGVCGKVTIGAIRNACGPVRS